MGIKSLHGSPLSYSRGAMLAEEERAHEAEQGDEETCRYEPPLSNHGSARIARGRALGADES